MNWKPEATHTPTATKWTNENLPQALIVETTNPNRTEPRFHIYRDGKHVTTIDGTLREAAGIAKH